MLHERDFAKKPFTKSEIEALLKGRDLALFVNPKSTPYKSLGLADKTLSRDELIELLAKEPNLFKRPFVIKGEKLVFGYSEEEYRKLV